MNKSIKYFMWLFAVLINIPMVFAKEVDSLGYYLQIAAENNPAIKADFLAYKAALQKLPQAGAFDDPNLEIGISLEPMHIIGGKQVADFSLMQMFPWFGTKKAAKNEAEHMAQASYQQFRETRDAKFLEVYSQWYLLGSLNQKLKNNEDNRRLLVQLRDLAKRKFTSPTSTPTASYTPPASTSSSPSGSSSSSSMSGMGGMGAVSATSDAPANTMGDMGGSMGSTSLGMSEVLRIELEIVELESNIESILSEIETEKIKFNTILNRSINTQLILPTYLEKVNYLHDTSTIDRVKANNPMLEMLVEEGKAYKAQGEMNKKMSYPMFSVGVQYTLVQKTNDPMFAMGSMNGKDMIMPMVSVSIPIFRNKYKAQQKESKLWWDANQEKYLSAVNELESELATAKHRLNDAQRKINLYNKQTQIAEATYNLAVREFAVGKNDLTNIIQVQRQLLDYKLKQAEATASYNTMVATIQKMISFTDFNQLKTDRNGN